MSIETLITDLIAAINANTAALKSAPVAEKPAKAAEAAPTPAPEEKKKPEPNKQRSGEEITAALNELKDKFGAAHAKGVITGLGFTKLAELLQDGTKNDAAYDAAKAKFAELTKEAEEAM